MNWVDFEYFLYLFMLMLMLLSKKNATIISLRSYLFSSQRGVSKRPSPICSASSTCDRFVETSVYLCFGKYVVEIELVGL